MFCVLCSVFRVPFLFLIPLSSGPSWSQSQSHVRLAVPESESIAPGPRVLAVLVLVLVLVCEGLVATSRQDFVAEAGASRKPAGPWGLFFGT